MDFVFCNPPASGTPEVITYDRAIEKLAAFYGINDVDGALDEVLSVSEPERPTWSYFKNKNKFGFLYGILTHSPDQNMRDDYASKLYWTLGTASLPAPDTPEEWSCLELLYNRFIHPFREIGTGSSHSTPPESPPSTPGGSSTAFESNASNPGPGNFRSALLKRDKVCLFCWDADANALDAAHLIAQKGGVPVTPLIQDLLDRAGLDSTYRVQNGVLLCASCHRKFDSLRRYFDVEDGRLVAKVVNLTSDRDDENYVDAVTAIQWQRFGKTQWNADFASRTVVVDENEPPAHFAVYFADNDESKHPNRTALSFHKAACLIWKLAGAGDDAEDDYTDGGGSVDGVLARVSDKLRSLETDNEGSYGTLRGLDDDE
ncbi:hypothetical protein BJ741DRAFT_655046 [Chytriomyces cf. hyalinus JEL632]|nr:hypothetical protein BJ741DRAFT_655046 [Chytriomyces cf. hyalinus JEL632]